MSSEEVPHVVESSTSNPASNNSSRVPIDDAVLKLKGLPYSTTEQEIADFFKDYQVKTVAFVHEPDGRPSGLAFVEFESKQEALRALARNGDYIGQRYVRLLHVTKAEMEEQVRLGTLAIPGAAAKLRSRLLRSHVQQARLLQPGIGGAVQQVIVPAGTQQVLLPGGRQVLAIQQPGGGLAVAGQMIQTVPANGQTAIAVDAQGYPLKVWQQSQSLPIHQQLAGLSLSNTHDNMQQHQHLHQPVHSQQSLGSAGSNVQQNMQLMLQPGANNAGGGGSLVSSSQSVDHVSGGALMHHHTVGSFTLTSNTNNTSTPTSSSQNVSMQAFSAAQQQQLQTSASGIPMTLGSASTLGSNTQLFTGGRPDQMSINGSRRSIGSAGLNRNGSGIPGMDSMMQRMSSVPQSSGDLTIANSSYDNINSGIQITQQTQQLILGNNGGVLSYVPYTGNMPMNSGMGQLSGFTGRVQQLAAQGYSIAQQPGVQQVNFGQPLMNQPVVITQTGLSGGNNVVTLQTGPSSTVKMRGLPYKASPAEILEFFTGYHYLPDSLQMGLDASGRPSGEAWLSFISGGEANRAVNDLNRRYLGTRYIELSVC